jgi:hypothetical protein
MAVANGGRQTNGKTGDLADFGAKTVELQRGIDANRAAIGELQERLAGGIDAIRETLRRIEDLLRGWPPK